MTNIDVVDVLWELVQADWEANTTKERVSKQNIKELIRRFILKVLDILHDGNNDLAYKQEIESLTLEEIITGEIGVDMRQANNTGYITVENHLSTNMKEAQDHLQSDPLDQSPQTLLTYLKNICISKPRLTIITNAMAKVNGDLGSRDKQKGEQNDYAIFNLLSIKFNYYYDIAYGRKGDDRNKLNLWLTYLKRSGETLSVDHQSKIGTHIGKLNEHIGTHFGKDEELKPLLKRVWEEYKIAIREMASNETNLFVRRQTSFGHRENRENLNKRKAPATSNSTQKTQSRNFAPQEKKQKTKDQKITKTRAPVETPCEMCKKGLQKDYDHSIEECWNFHHEQFTNHGKLVKKTPEEKKAQRQSFNNKNKSDNNYFAAYNAQLKPPEVKATQEGQEELEIMIDGGSNMNVCRDLNLFVSTSKIDLKLKSLGRTHHVTQGGIVEVYAKTHDDNIILLRFDAIYVPPISGENTHILSLSQLVQKARGCYCIGECHRKCSMEQDSLTLTTLSGEKVRLKTKLNNMSRISVTKNGPERCQVVDISTRQALPANTFRERDEHQDNEIPDSQHDSDDESDTYTVLIDGEVYSASLIPDNTDPENENIDTPMITPKQPRSNRDQIMKENAKLAKQKLANKNSKIGNKTTQNLTISPEEEKREKEYVRMLKDKDKAMEIHQKMGHMSPQKINESLRLCVSVPQYAQLSKSVKYHLQNIKCDQCELTRNSQIRHPVSHTNNRSKFFGQNWSCDVAYGPNRFKALIEGEFHETDVFNKGFNPWKQSEMPKTETDDYISRVGFEGQLSLIFVDEFSRWTIVVPLRNLKEDDFISAFMVFQSELVKMMRKYQNNQKRQEDGTAQRATGKPEKFNLFSQETRIQQVLTDQQTGIYKSDKFRKFIKEWWRKDPSDKSPEELEEHSKLGFTETIMTYVNPNEHAHNGIVERRIRTLKEKAMVSLLTAFGHLPITELDYAIRKYWFFALQHAACTVNVMAQTIRGKVETSPYSHITGKLFPIDQLYPFFAEAAAPGPNKLELDYASRLRNPSIKNPTARNATSDTRNKGAKSLPSIKKDSVRYLYTDLTGHKIQPVVFNEGAWKINKQALTSTQMGNRMKNLLMRTQSTINARTFIHQDPRATPPTDEQIDVLNKYAAYVARLHVEDNERTDEMGDLESFLGCAIPRPIWSPVPERKTKTGHRGQNSVASEPMEAASHESESTTHVQEVYYCPSVGDHEDDTSTYTHIDGCLSTEQNINNTAQEAYMINCESKNFELKEAEPDFFNAENIKQSRTTPDKFWTFAVSRINSEEGGEVKKKTIADYSKEDIDKAVKKEMNGIIDKDVLEHIPHDQWVTMWPRNKVPKKCETRMVLTVKENGEIKARLVAKGFRQRAGENYFQTFSPVVDRTSVNTLINIAAIKGLPLYSLDISQAFLQAPIDEDVYITYDGEIYKLKKALYGTKQASRMWNKEITKALKSYGMEQTKTDPCVFVKYEQPRSKFEKPQPQVFVCVSTDDLLVATEKEHWVKLAKALSHEHQGRFITSQVNWNEECTSFNGIEIKRENNNKYSINLNTYTSMLLSEWSKQYQHILPREDIPMYGRQASDKFKEKQLIKCDAREIKEYQSIVGQVTWLSSNTRPDLIHFTSSASRAAKDPNKGQLTIVRQIIGYLKSRPTMSIVFDGNGIDKVSIEAFTDAGESHTAFTSTLPNSDLSHSKHTSGFNISMGSGSLVWKTKRQPRVSNSICHGEYIAAELCLQEVKFIRDLLSDIGFPQNQTIMFIDNQASIKLMLNNQSTKKHDRITLHLLQEAVEDKNIIPVYIPSDQNVSDMFTKANAVQTNGHNHELISRINGSAWSATRYRDHIKEIVRKHYTKGNMVSDVPSAQKLLELVF